MLVHYKTQKIKAKGLTLSVGSEGVVVVREANDGEVLGEALLGSLRFA